MPYEHTDETECQVKECAGTIKALIEAACHLHCECCHGGCQETCHAGIEQVLALAESHLAHMRKCCGIEAPK